LNTLLLTVAAIHAAPEAIRQGISWRATRPPQGIGPQRRCQHRLAAWHTFAASCAANVGSLLAAAPRQSPVGTEEFSPGWSARALVQARRNPGYARKISPSPIGTARRASGSTVIATRAPPAAFSAVTTGGGQPTCTRPLECKMYLEFATCLARRLHGAFRPAAICPNGNG
jgi:hypothetical protein